jgi:NOL1/NOP2/fmu family ribosome biogenesis protein
VQAKPKQIGLNPQQRFRSIPWGIEVINSQEPLTTAAAGLKPRQQRRLEIAEMQNTSWRWSEAAAITASLPQPVALIELEKEMVRTTH